MTNSKDNQNCWTCRSFQIYQNAQEPTGVYGECRWQPKVGRLENDDQFNQYVPYIPNAVDFWCSKWKKSELTLPTQPEPPIPGVWPDVWTAFQADPWNNHAQVNESCWNCNHYQRDYEDPTEPGMNTGECRKNPVCPTLDLVVDINSDTLQGLKFKYAGSDWFCSCWERSQDTVPVDPGPNQ